MRSDLSRSCRGRPAIPTRALARSRDFLLRARRAQWRPNKSRKASPSGEGDAYSFSNCLHDRKDFLYARQLEASGSARSDRRASGGTANGSARLAGALAEDGLANDRLANGLADRNAGLANDRLADRNDRLAGLAADGLAADGLAEDLLGANGRARGRSGFTSGRARSRSGFASGSARSDRLASGGFARGGTANGRARTAAQSGLQTSEGTEARRARSARGSASFNSVAGANGFARSDGSAGFDRLARSDGNGFARSDRLARSNGNGFARSGSISGLSGLSRSGNGIFSRSDILRVVSRSGGFFLSERVRSGND